MSVSVPVSVSVVNTYNQPALLRVMEVVRSKHTSARSAHRRVGHGREA